MSARIEPLMTVDDLDAMPEDGNRYEVIEGELFVSCAPGLPHQLVAGNIFYEFRKYLEEHPLGIVVTTPGLVFAKYSGVIPDIVFFTHQRGQEIISGERLVAAPDIVIELLSSGRENIARDRVAKRQLYSKYGVSEYWIVDSENRAVQIYRLAGGTLDLSASLKGEDEITSLLLPGFSYPVTNVFKQ